MPKKLKLGSLFAGIGGFDLAAIEAGIQPVFCCEIEPYPRLVLSARFPDVKQYGDIRKLNGAEAEPVDIITFGSPCQSFSQAAGALRNGLDGASGLFHEAVRVIKEMREATNGQYPRYAIMENVVGIYSSKSQGKSDFREVLNELLKIKNQAVHVPLPAVNKGKFLTAGAVVGDGYSLAYRTLCASQFGVAQRRRRMFLVVDFDGECAAEILSEQEGKGRNFTPSYLAREGAAGGAAAGVGGVTYFEPGILQRLDRSICENKTNTIRSHMGDNQGAVAYAAPIDMRNATRVTDSGQGVGVGEVGDPAFTVTAEQQHAIAVSSHPSDSRLKIEETSLPALTAKMGTGGGNTHFVLDERKQCAPVTEDYVGSLTATDHKGAACIFQPTIAIAGNVIGRKDENGPAGIGFKEEQSYTLNTVDSGGAVAYQKNVGALCSSDYKGIRNQDIDEDKAVVETFGNNGHGKWNGEPATLKASGGDHLGGENLCVENSYAVRRLTPLECLRLQGLPDDHLDNIHIAEPTDAQIAHWRGVWAELGKTKTDNQIRKFLREPYSDSNAYKAIGNSLCVPCALWVLRGIVAHASNIHGTY